MSMLAERKQKQRWSLNPRGKMWSEDSNKLGQKLMEKMGWKHGKGLGANEDGNTEHVKVSYKNDSKGMGYKESTEQWTEHDDNFTGLLKNLNGDTDNNEIKLNSIHEIAEMTKTRINYHKYTKGKDLSRYSEKDLANIFGKKSFAPKPETATIPEETKPSVIIESDNLVERGSMTDYFKKKLPNFGKNAFGLKIGSNGVLTKDDSETDERPAFGFGFKQIGDEKPKGRKRKYEETEIVPEPIIEELPKVKKSKKKKKKTAESFVSYLNNVGNTDEPVKLEDKDIADEPPREKKKKSGDVITEVGVEEDSPKSKKRSKKPKRNEEINATPEENNQNGEETETPIRKQKKSKKNKLNEEDVTAENNENREDTPVGKGKKSKKQSEDTNADETETPNSERKKKKKSKKHPNVEENQEVEKTKKKKHKEGVLNAAFDGTFKSPPKPEEGITNPAFDPLYNKVTIEKHTLNTIEETNEDYVGKEPTQEKNDSEQSQAKRKKRRKNKKNPRNEEGNGMSNPGFDDKPSEIECDLMLNVHTAPAQPKRRKNVRFSDVNEQRIIPNNTMRERNELFDINNEVIERGIQDDPANKGFVNNGFDIRSIDDVSFCEGAPGFDRREANLEEKVKTMLKSMENCEAEVDNDINERRVVGRGGYSSNRGGSYRGTRGRAFMRPYGRGGYGNRMQDPLNIRVGECGEPAENHYQVPGGVRLSFRDVKFSNKVPPWARRPCGNLSKQGYKHLIKGDIILNFKSANMHEVKGYAV